MEPIVAEEDEAEADEEMGFSCRSCSFVKR